MNLKSFLISSEICSKYFGDWKYPNKSTLSGQDLKSGDYDIRFLGTDYLKGNYTGKDIPIDIVWLNRNHNYSSTHLKAEIYNSVKYRKDRELRFD